MADVEVEFEASSMPERLTKSMGAERSETIKTSDATVVIATYDMKRWSQLESAVESLLSDTDLPGCVVISVDQNRELHEKICAKWPQITTVLNSDRRGVSTTRNTGAGSVQTPFIVFLDDDIQVYRGWLWRLLEPFADPTVVGTGGGVVAGWETGRPSWFPAEFDWVVAASYRGMPVSRSVIRNVWAENMAVRAEVFRAVGGFRSDFGKVGDRSNPEDTDLCIRMAAGSPTAKWIYVPDALVEHHVPAGRAKWSYFLRRNYLEGRGKLEMARLLGSSEKLQSERDYLRRTLPLGIFSGLWAAVRHGDISGLLKAGAIVAGVISAGVGVILEMCPFQGKTR
jgi:glucosyl-dolichyl phosphate glucuronosyltransferase